MQRAGAGLFPRGKSLAERERGGHSSRRGIALWRWRLVQNHELRDPCRPGRRLQSSQRCGILGTLIGAHAIPAEYSEPIHNTYWNKSLAGLPDSYEVDALAVDTAQIGLKVLLANGAEVVSRSGKLVLRIPLQDPVPPPNLEQVKWDGDKPVF